MESATITASPPAAAVAEGSTRRRLPRPRWWVLGAGAAALLAAALVWLGTWPPIATVMSGSMAPHINTGDVVLLGRVGTPHVGDVVAVSVPDAARKRYGYPPEVIHRVIRIGGGRLQTKGDALHAPDPFTVPVSSVRAHVVFTLPAAGRVFAFLESPLGLLWLAIGGVLLVGMPLVEQRRAHEAEEQAAFAALHDELRTISAELAHMREEVAHQPVVVPPPPPAPAPEPEPVDTWPDAYVHEALDVPEDVGATALLDASEFLDPPEYLYSPVEPGGRAEAHAAAEPDPSLYWDEPAEPAPPAQLTAADVQVVHVQRTGGLVRAVTRRARMSRYH